MNAPSLMRSERRAWWTFAPAVLAANGDTVKEDAAYARPGVRAARALYDSVTAEIHERARYERATMQLDQCAFALTVADALDRAA